MQLGTGLAPVVPLSLAFCPLLYFRLLSVFLACPPLPCKCSLGVQQNKHDHSFLSANAFLSFESQIRRASLPFGHFPGKFFPPLPHVRFMRVSGSTMHEGEMQVLARTTAAGNAFKRDRS